MTTSLFLAFSALIAWIGTAWVCRNARRLKLVQAPNHRSSHVQPTPHGGGLGVVLAGTVSGAWVAWGTDPEWWAIAFLGFSLAAVGLWDDIRHLRASVRFSVQLIVCFFLLWALGELPARTGGLSLTLPFFPDNESIMGRLSATALLLFAGVWWINLFNFMDGIDGIAASQTVFMLLAAAGLCTSVSADATGSAGWLWMLALAAAASGFLLLNWPPARIFMGDVGSTYLAFMILALALISVREGWMTYTAWSILGALFVADATVTLVRRMIRGDRWFEAHRSHAYQRLARRWGSHRPVTLFTIVVNLLWLAPLAWASLTLQQWALGFATLAYVPLVLGCILMGAGRRENA